MEEEGKSVIKPTIKGYEKAFLALCNLLKFGKIDDDDYLILDIYSRMVTGMRTEELLKSISNKDFAVVKEGKIVSIMVVR